MLLKFIIFMCILHFGAPVRLYPYGWRHNDQRLKGADSFAILTLTKPMPLFTTPRSKVWITTDGVVSFTGNIRRMYGDIPGTGTYTSLFDTNLNTYGKDGEIFYRQTFDKAILSEATADVKRLNVSNFKATRAIVVSYYKVPKNVQWYLLHTFQLVLVTDELVSYAIVNYDRLDYDGQVDAGFTETKNHYLRFAPPDQVRTLVRTSNVGVIGKHVYKLTQN